MSERKRLFQDTTLEEQADLLADLEEYNRQTGQNLKVIRQEPYKPEARKKEIREMLNP